jgi:hypothetical protein
MRLANSIVAITFAAALPVVAFAGTHDPGVNHRQANQQAPIHQGVQSGELTRSEAHRLEADQRHIRREERAFKSDGQLTGWERRDLQWDQNTASRDIYRQRHDGQVRPYTAHPAVRDPGVNRMQHDQQARIAQGVRSGELTRDEAQALRGTERSIRAEERAYKSDGKLAGQERADLRQDLGAASRSIYGEKHDAERRF